MTPLWSQKYLDVVPSTFVPCFPFGSDSGPDDEQLKIEINASKNALSQSNYRCRFAVVLVGDMSTTVAPDLDERLAAIRRAVKLDGKTFFYIPADFSPEELGSMAETILSALRPACLDFYRDMTKQVRRKKDRGSTPSSPVPEEAQHLIIPKSGWTARYEYKLGFFAEMRSEMDAASRHYNAALDALFDIRGVFDTVSNWSPHWNAARLFADAIAVHQLRCSLANGLPTETSRFFLRYHDIVRQLLDNKGKGTNNYGWQAWQARWAQIMARLIAESPAHTVDINTRKAIETLFRSKGGLYASMERSAGTDEPFNPWDLLHHPGYWLVLSSSYIKARRRHALEMPEGDRTPPGQSPSSRVARRYEIYDTYLVPEPHEEWPLEADGIDYTSQIVNCLQEATNEFVHRGQPSMASRVRLFTARELAYAGRWPAALELTKPLWPGHKWRRSGWWNGVGEVALILHRSAKACDDRSSEIKALWELMSGRFKVHEDVNYELMSLMKSMSGAERSATNEGNIILRHEDIVSFLNISFAFVTDESNAGETIQAQITLTSTAHPKSQAVVFDKLKIELDGEVRSIELENTVDAAQSGSDEGSTHLSNIDLSGAGATLSGAAVLSVAPGETKVFTMSIDLHEAGSIRAVRAFATIETETVKLEYSQTLQAYKALTYWWTPATEAPRQRLAYHRPDTIRVQPKLPKVIVSFTERASTYYTDEHLTLDVDIINHEHEDILLTLEIRMPGHENQVLEIHGMENAATTDSPSQRAGDLTYKLGTMAAAAAQKISMSTRLPSIPGNMPFEVKAIYHLVSKPDSPLTKTSSTTINVQPAFDIDHSIRPDLHPSTWPSFFTAPITQASNSSNDSNEGIINRWTVTSSLLSLASERLIIEKAELSITSVSEGAHCTVLEASAEGTITLPPKTQHDLNFTLDTTRLLLDDLRTITVDGSLIIHWCRQDSTTQIVTTIPAPTFRLPASEPRALMSLSSPSTENPSETTSSATAPSSTLTLHLTLENPSLHFLTFQCSLDPNEDFAFSGPKVTTIHLVPMSRCVVKYALLPFAKGGRLKPVIRVADVHFDKALIVHAVGKGVERDEAGLRVDSEM